MYAAEQGYDHVRVRTPDSDIFWILLNHANKIRCNILFDSGHGNKKRLLNLTEIAKHYGDPMCSSMMALHVFTGCDFTSCFKGNGKVKALKILLKSPGFRRLFHELGTSWNKAEDLLQEAEKFVCAMYGKPKVTSVDKLRFLLLKAKLGEDVSLKPKQDIDFSKMPPPAVCLLEHLKRVNYVVRIWRQATNAIIEIPKPYDNHGWTKEGEPLWCPPGKILPESIVMLWLT